MSDRPQLTFPSLTAGEIVSLTTSGPNWNIAVTFPLSVITTTSGLSPFTPGICAMKSDELRALLAADAYANYDAWAGGFETGFNDFIVVLNRWRQDRRIESLLQSQLDSFDRANPKPIGRMTAAQSRAINIYAEQVTSTLAKLLAAQKGRKLDTPLKSQEQLFPERGLEIVVSFVRELSPDSQEAPKKRAPRITNKTIPGLSIMTPRDAVLRNAQVFSDVWALGVAWDYASYVLMLAFLFFPSAERAAGRKDDQGRSL